MIRAAKEAVVSEDAPTSGLIRAAYATRVLTAHGAPLVGLTALASAVVYDTNTPLPVPALVVVALAWAGFVGWRLTKRRSIVNRLHRTLVDFELGVAALLPTFLGLVRLEGRLDGSGYGLVLVVVGIASAVASPICSFGLVLALAGLELAVRTFGVPDGASPLPAVITHAALASLLSIVNHVLLRKETSRLRERVKATVEAEIDRQKDAARSYRLLGAPRSLLGKESKGDEERLARSSVEEIHQAVLFSLDLLRRSMHLHSAMLLWLNDQNTHLRVAELSSDEGDVVDGPYLSGDGIFGAALSKRAVVSLHNLKSSYRLPYYEGPCPVGSACAVPVLEHGEIRGLLIADRTTGVAFTPRDEELLQAATRYAVRAIQNERVFVQLERAKVEQGKLYRAAEHLGAAVNEGGVVEVAVKSAREIAAFDFAAVTLFDAEEEMHEIRAVSGDGADNLLGARFPHNTGLVAMVVQNLHPLPYKGEVEEGQKQKVFSHRLPMPPMASVLVLPLVVRDRPLGTLVLGARRRGAFGDAVRPTLEVLARHVAVSLANARMVKKLEEMATTDGMTGLLNKRALLQVAGDKIAASARFRRKLSLLVTDIDFFKKVNDNYGHDVGDVVIKGLGDILRRVKRGTDSVARFGGEEFVMICEETDDKGAMLLAERIRTELSATVFPTPKGPLRVTCSVGLATFPDGGRDYEQLFKAADDALYASKEGGRNRSTAWFPGVRGPAKKVG
jgi:two-component system, cell cycle response regulator